MGLSRPRSLAFSNPTRGYAGCRATKLYKQLESRVSERGTKGGACSTPHSRPRGSKMYVTNLVQTSVWNSKRVRESFCRQWSKQAVLHSPLLVLSNVVSFKAPCPDRVLYEMCQGWKMQRRMAEEQHNCPGINFFVDHEPGTCTNPSVHRRLNADKNA